MVSMMIEYNLYNTALRIINGCSIQVAINDHIHQWNRMRSRMLYLEEPPLSGKDYVDAWLAATAEYESFIIGDIPPQWTENTCRFLKKAWIIGGTGGKNIREIALAETPGPWRRRMVFCGKTTIC